MNHEYTKTNFLSHFSADRFGLISCLLTLFGTWSHFCVFDDFLESFLGKNENQKNENTFQKSKNDVQNTSKNLFRRQNIDFRIVLTCFPNS